MWAGKWCIAFWVLMRKHREIYLHSIRMSVQCIRTSVQCIQAYLGLFKVKIQNGNIFSAAKFQIFLGMPEGPRLCMKKN